MIRIIVALAVLGALAGGTQINSAPTASDGCVGSACVTTTPTPPKEND